MRQKCLPVSSFPIGDAALQPRDCLCGVRNETLMHGLPVDPGASPGFSSEVIEIHSYFLRNVSRELPLDLRARDRPSCARTQRYGRRVARACGDIRHAVTVQKAQSYRRFS